MPSSLIDVLSRHREDTDLLHLPDELSELAVLSEVLDQLPDPRRVRGRRYRLGSLLALCLLAVLGGATTLARIARYAIDTAPEVRARIGLRRPPRASTLGRLLSRLDVNVDEVKHQAQVQRRQVNPFLTSTIRPINDRNVMIQPANRSDRGDARSTGPGTTVSKMSYTRSAACRTLVPIASPTGSIKPKITRLTALTP
ncbi:transposase family protein [Streptomyces sp. NPDC058378]|uniref:transposase family protein n=1 Tax=Streptomyces sp. NPDC058378 TaxID=3346469 RepID=UPI003667C7A3